MREGNSARDDVTIYVAQGMLRAMAIRECLESASIPVTLRYETPHTTPKTAAEGKGRVNVMVPPEWELEARTLLNANPRTGEIFCVPSE
ncbi:MAG: hypothetical protein P1S60_02120 [Anaerolineae bacterium]|nr:hypothetical protein [Anaerolineae bacterium]